MRISRPDYDKPRRCPGWSGGGWNYAKKIRCKGSMVEIRYPDPLWKFKFRRCPKCRVIILPYIIYYLSPMTWLSKWRTRNWY